MVEHLCKLVQIVITQPLFVLLL